VAHHQDALFLRAGGAERGDEVAVVGLAGDRMGDLARAA